MNNILQFRNPNYSSKSTEKRSSDNFLHVLYYSYELDAIRAVCNRHISKEEFTTTWFVLSSMAESIQEIVGTETDTSFMCDPAIDIYTHVLELDVLIETITKDIDNKSVSQKERLLLEKIRERLIACRDPYRGTLLQYAKLSEEKRTRLLTSEWIKEKGSSIQ